MLAVGRLVRIEKTEDHRRQGDVISKSTFYNTFDYFGCVREVEDWTVIWELVFLYSQFLEKWGDDTFFENRMELTWDKLTMLVMVGVRTEAHSLRVQVGIGSESDCLLVQRKESEIFQSFRFRCWPEKIQESRAAAKKPRDAEAIRFNLMFANQTNLTKQNRWCLKADVNANVQRHLPYPHFSRNFGCSLYSRPRSMMLLSLHTDNTRLISRGIIFDVLRTTWSRYLNVTDTFCQFCGICGISDLESRLRWSEIVDFCTNRKRLYDFLLVLCPILPRFKDIRTFVRQRPLFRYPSLFRSKFQDVPLE